jgi:hypothetical protein
MSKHLKAGIRAAPAGAAMPPSPAGPNARPRADEDDGTEDPADEPLAPWDDDGWPMPWGAARLGIP